MKIRRWGIAERGRSGEASAQPIPLKARLLTGFFVILTGKGFESEKEGSTRTRGGWKYAGEALPSEDAAAKRQRSQSLSINKKDNPTFYVRGYFTD